MVKIYGMSASGNCYKARLLLEQLHLDYEWQEIDPRRGDTRTPAFLAMNPAGQVPVMEAAPGRFLTESNAILCYLADGSDYWPTERFAKAATLSWMFFEQYSHEPYVAVARSICRFLPPEHPRRGELPALLEKGGSALQIMEDHLRQHEYFAGARYSIADIALYAYTHCAAEGGFALTNYPAIGAWLERVAAQPGYRAM